LVLFQISSIRQIDMKLNYVRMSENLRPPEFTRSRANLKVEIRTLSHLESVSEVTQRFCNLCFE
jgi:hypothetical protein